MPSFSLALKTPMKKAGQGVRESCGAAETMHTPFHGSMCWWMLAAFEMICDTTADTYSHLLLFFSFHKIHNDQLMII